VLPSREERLVVEEGYRAVLDDAQVRWTTAESQARRLTNSVGYLGRYLGLVGLAALLLGGVGVGSAVHVFVRERRTAISVLRCLGAHQRSVFAAYLLQASRARRWARRSASPPRRGSRCCSPPCCR
jgi:putative ABC transport system permease protein